MIFRILLLLFLILALGLFIFFRNKIIRFYWILIAVIFIVYVTIVIWFTFYDREYSADYQFSLIPFESYLTMIRVGWSGWGVYIFYGLVGNVFLFVPVGMLVAQVSRIKHKYLAAGIAGFVFSFAIEMTQLFTMLGTFEVDDLIHNTWGAVIGCAIAITLIKQEKSIKANIKTLMPMIVFIVLITFVSFFSIIRDTFIRIL